MYMGLPDDDMAAWEAIARVSDVPKSRTATWRVVESIIVKAGESVDLINVGERDESLNRGGS
jgi:hypothetical protein